MRPFICLLAFLLLITGATRPVVGATPTWRPLAADTTALPLDTARALSQFFAHRRKHNRTLLGPSALAVATFNYSLAYSKSETTFQQVSLGINAGLVAFFSYRLGSAIVQLRRYRVGREQVLLAALAKGRPLPRPIRKQLLAYLRPVPNR